MKAPLNTLLALAASATSAYAANGAQADEPGILCWAFMGFAAVIIVGQLVPALLLMYGTLKGIVSSPEPEKSKYW